MPPSANVLSMSGLGRLAAWHLSSGPVFSPSGWAATPNFEIGQTTNPVNGARVGREGEKGARKKVRKRRRGKE